MIEKGVDLKISTLRRISHALGVQSDTLDLGAAGRILPLSSLPTCSKRLKDLLL